MEKDPITGSDKKNNDLYLKTRGINTESRQYSLDFFGNGDPSKKMQPNDIARSALWSIQTTLERPYLENQPIYTSDPTIQMFYTGKALQATTDEKIWMQLVDYAKSVPLGQKVQVRVSQICKDIGWKKNGQYYKCIWESLERLHYGGLKVKKGKNKIIAFIRMLNLHTARNIDKDNNNLAEIENDGMIEYSLDDSFHGWLLLVAGKNTTMLSSEPMKKLTPTAQRLYTYVASHKEPYPISIFDFHQLCDSDYSLENSTKVAGWRRSCKTAITILEKNKLIETGHIDKNMIHIKRCP